MTSSLLSVLLALVVPGTPPDEGLVPRTYPVADLVVPLGGAGAAGGKAPATVEGQLIRLITGTVAPGSWEERGGRGRLRYYEPTLALTVWQTPAVQGQVAEVLTSLRRLQEQQVVLEFKVLSLSEAFFERIGVDFEVTTGGGKAAAPAVQVVQFTRTPTWKDLCDKTVLDDKQVKRLLEAVEGDSRANVMQSPKVTVANGQEATVQVGDSHRFVTGCAVERAEGKTTFTPKEETVQTGLRLAARAAVTPDGKSVVVRLQASRAELDGPVPVLPLATVEGDGGKPLTQLVQQPSVRRVGVEDTVTIPDGGTVVLGGLSQVVETRVESCPPVVSKVPYLNRLFKNVGVGREAQQWVLLVTARVISSGEKEQGEGLRRSYDDVQKLCPGTPLAALAAQASAAAAVRGASEEQEPREGRVERAIGELLRAYDEACAAGRREEAARLAGAALALDPTCFRRR